MGIAPAGLGLPYCQLVMCMGLDTLERAAPGAPATTPALPAPSPPPAQPVPAATAPAPSSKGKKQLTQMFVHFLLVVDFSMMLNLLSVFSDSAFLPGDWRNTQINEYNGPLLFERQPSQAGQRVALLSRFVCWPCCVLFKNFGPVSNFDLAEEVLGWAVT